MQISDAILWFSCLFCIFFLVSAKQLCRGKSTVIFIATASHRAFRDLEWILFRVLVTAVRLGVVFCLFAVFGSS